MVDVFISYSRMDKEPVARLARAIEDEGYDVWWDAELPPHQSYGDVITSKISEAKAAIVVWSADAAASEWVRAEADMARNQKKLVQTALGDIMPPLPFNQIQYADIGDWLGEDDHPSWRKVKASLADLCGRNGPDPTIASASEPAFAPPPPAPEPEPAEQEPIVYATPAPSSNGPLFAGLGFGAIALAAIAAFFLWPQSEAEDPALAGSSSAQQNEDVEIDTGEEPEPEANPPDIPENWILATVEDPDGHSNVRARPTTSSEIVGRAQVGEVFRARREPGNWWPVELSDGTTGYIARRLIRVKGTDEPAPAPTAAPPPQARRVQCTFDNTAFSYDGPCEFTTTGSDGDFTAISLDGPFFMNVSRIALDVTNPEQGVLTGFADDGSSEEIAVTRSTVDRACWEGPLLSFCAR